jgi:hypothetical protein
MGQLRVGTTCTTQSCSSVCCENIISKVVTLINEVMMNLTLLELATIAVALDEDSAERKRRSWAVHPAWRSTESEGEFFTLYKELIDDEVKFYGYFQTNRQCFCALLRKVSPLLIKQRTILQKPISPKERLAVCIR